MTQPTKAVQVRVEGRVQGVGFRAWVERTAGKLALSGWVRNRRDGSVEAVFAGPVAAVDDMLEHCRFGPRLADVTGIKVSPAEGAFTGFEVRPTE